MVGSVRLCCVQLSWWLTAIDADDKGFTGDGRQKVLSGCGVLLCLIYIAKGIGHRLLQSG